ncbi:hypothetical protein BGZ99_001120 [Dissophora globulifera]|uniref:Cytochrome b561 domain-containing protein n=1 Tax=Dissophora globulifera TaxID=979702 RepID=A0A9P6UXY5_9FUNG|nr:hypothetical protein BGZ99_001120 [Dissophora globulifera]
MHHPANKSSSLPVHDERRPLIVPSSSAHPTQLQHETPTEGYRAIDESHLPLSQGNRSKHDSNNNDEEFSSSDTESDSSSTDSTPSDPISSLSGTELLLEQGSNPPPAHRRSHHRSSQSGRRRKMVLAVTAQLGLVVFFGTLASVIFKAPWVYPYSWHPICMGLYGFVATEAILILQPPEKSSEKKLARTLHGLFHTLALVLSLCGFTAIYVNKDRLQKPHFHTNHALFGCTTVSLFFLQVVFGIAVAYGPRALFAWIGHARITRIHRISGYISIGLLWSTLWLGVLTNWMKNNFDHEWVFALGGAMIAVGLVGQITPARLFGSSKHSHHRGGHDRSS